MKYFLILSFCISATFACAQNNSATRGNIGEHTHVQQVITRLFDGISTLNMKIISDCMAKDFTVLEDGRMWNLDSIEVQINQMKGIKFTRDNRFNFIKTEVKGNTAWVAYHNTADMIINDMKVVINWLESAVLIREGKAWKIQLLHSTEIKAS
jgi:hypothetical protein